MLVLVVVGLLVHGELRVLKVRIVMRVVFEICMEFSEKNAW